MQEATDALMSLQLIDLRAMAEDTAEIASFHAHVYFNATTRETAARVRQELGDRFEVQLGRWHDQLVGPPTQPMYQVALAPDQFDKVVPWLMRHRQGLAILVHPNTGVASCPWLGENLAVNLEPLRPASFT